MKIKRSKLVSHLINLYDNFRMAEFMDQSVDCVDINICAMRMLCFRFERHGRTDAPSMWLTEHGIKALEAVAQKGDPVAQSNLGQCYKYGLGVEFDGAKAIEWFEKSAAQGYVRGVASLGVTLLHENSPEKANRGLALLRKAVDKGCAPAMCNLGLHLLTIAKTKKQYNEAKQLIYRSAEAGVVEGYVRLCNSEMIDREEIAQCTRKAWEQGFDISGRLDPLDFSYGSICGRDLLKTFSLPRLPIEKLKRKAEHDAVAKTYLAYLSLDGHLGLPLDHKLAKNQFEQAAKKALPRHSQCWASAITGGMAARKTRTRHSTGFWKLQNKMSSRHWDGSDICITWQKDAGEASGNQLGIASKRRRLAISRRNIIWLCIIWDCSKALNAIRRGRSICFGRWLAVADPRRLNISDCATCMVLALRKTSNVGMAFWRSQIDSRTLESCRAM